MHLMIMLNNINVPCFCERFFFSYLLSPATHLPDLFFLALSPYILWLAFFPLFPSCFSPFTGPVAVVLLEFSAPWSSCQIITVRGKPEFLTLYRFFLTVFLWSWFHQSQACINSTHIPIYHSVPEAAPGPPTMQHPLWPRTAWLWESALGSNTASIICYCMWALEWLIYEMKRQYLPDCEE